jgi:hypothetical protein
MAQFSKSAASDQAAQVCSTEACRGGKGKKWLLAIQHTHCGSHKFCDVVTWVSQTTMFGLLMQIPLYFSLRHSAECTVALITLVNMKMINQW